MIKLPEDPPPHLVAMADQVHAEVQANRRDNTAAVAESRCAAKLAGGCGKPIDFHSEFRDKASQREYQNTRLCQDCQDQLFMPPAEEMYENLKDFGRCGTCGLWRDYVHIDVGVGIISGFNCCGTENPPVPYPGRCDKEPGCFLGKGHALNCEHNIKAVY
jgi:hypothetical protein